MTSAPTIAAQPKNKTWHHQSAEDVLTQLGSSATGLSTQEAAQRLAADGCGWGVFVTYLMSGKFKETKCRLIGSCRDTPHIWGGFSENRKNHRHM